MKVKGEYNIDEANYNLNISYEYYWDDGNYFNPPESDLEILEVTLNGMDITDFYWDWVDDAIHSQVWDYAQENRNEKGVVVITWGSYNIDKGGQKWLPFFYYLSIL